MFTSLVSFLGMPLTRLQGVLFFLWTLPHLQLQLEGQGELPFCVL